MKIDIHPCCGIEDFGDRGLGESTHEQDCRTPGDSHIVTGIDNLLQSG